MNERPRLGMGGGCSLIGVEEFRDTSFVKVSLCRSAVKTNLSLGDALCLGAAEALGADVMTAEHGWATLPDLPFEVQLIRWPT